MTILPLYTGNGISLSPQNADGRVLSNYVRLVADENKAITNGTTIISCIDILNFDIDKWSDCEMPLETDTEATTEDLYNALAEFGVE